MARLAVEGTDIVVHLSLREKALAHHRNVRVPVSTLRQVHIEPDWWRALRGERDRGICIPGQVCAGVRHLREGQDFTLVRAGTQVLCVELRPSAPFSRLAISVPDPEKVMGTLLPLVPRNRLG